MGCGNCKIFPFAFGIRRKGRFRGVEAGKCGGSKSSVCNSLNNGREGVVGMVRATCTKGQVGVPQLPAWLAGGEMRPTLALKVSSIGALLMACCLLPVRG